LHFIMSGKWAFPTKMWAIKKARSRVAPSFKAVSIL
jgi:hypothetical protein